MAPCFTLVGLTNTITRACILNTVMRIAVSYISPSNSMVPKQLSFIYDYLQRRKCIFTNLRIRSSKKTTSPLTLQISGNSISLQTSELAISALKLHQDSLQSFIYFEISQNIFTLGVAQGSNKNGLKELT